MKYVRPTGCRTVLLGAVLLCHMASRALCDEPPVINPFGRAPTEREDAVPGYVSLSDGTIAPGFF